MKRLSFLTALVLAATFLMSLTIDLDNLFNYANQSRPAYITKDNTVANPITDAGATLGRVLFYDKKLSVNNTIACASCHQQQFAFGDTSIASIGVNGSTGRHAMRLINARFSAERKFFWDERAATLEAQTTMPIQDHKEMGYSGTLGDPDFADLIAKLDTVSYYRHLFKLAFGDTQITENRMQRALAQFVRSIQSFDAKYDAGRAQVPNDMVNFPNFSTEENMGKNLFLAPPVFNPNSDRVGGGAGCAGCHRAPEFDIDPNSRNNGFALGIDNALDLNNTRAPSLRDLVNTDGQPNGPMMHHGGAANLLQVIEHYNVINVIPQNTNLDPRLMPGGNGQKLNLTNQEKNALVAFLRTLSGTDVYTNPMWSDPFDANGNLELIGGTTAVQDLTDKTAAIRVFPNPARDFIQISGLPADTEIRVLGLNGQLYQTIMTSSDNQTLDIQQLPAGVYLLAFQQQNDATVVVKKMVKQD